MIDDRNLSHPLFQRFDFEEFIPILIDKNLSNTQKFDSEFSRPPIKKELDKTVENRTRSSSMNLATQAESSQIQLDSWSAWGELCEHNAAQTTVAVGRNNCLNSDTICRTPLKVQPELTTPPPTPPPTHPSTTPRNTRNNAVTNELYRAAFDGITHTYSPTSTDLNNTTKDVPAKKDRKIPATRHCYNQQMGYTFDSSSASAKDSHGLTAQQRYQLTNKIGDLLQEYYSLHDETNVNVVFKLALNEFLESSNTLPICLRDLSEGKAAVLSCVVGRAGFG